MGVNSVKTVVVAATASGNNTIVAAVAGACIELIGYLIVSDNSAVSAKWRSDDTDLTGAMPLPAGMPNGFRVPFSRCIVSTAKGEALKLNLSAAVNVAGFAIVRIGAATP